MASMNGWVAVAAIVATAACSGCAARTTTSVPVGFAELTFGGTFGYFPHTVYQGRDVYYVEGRWIYQNSAGDWVYYPVEPRPLHRYRMTVQQAPPAPRPERYQPRTPPRTYRPAKPAPAPPATRVR